jgi:glycolate oxidase FAD binding subunit
MTIFRPASDKDVQELVAWAVTAGQSLELVAGGSKRALGRPVTADHTLDLSLLTGITAYDPGELVLTAKPGTKLAEIEAVLAEQRQILAFEPPEWRGLFGKTGTATLGGTIACNLAGPRRVRAGAPRDHVLGFAAVNGWGHAWKGGGKVVKNVTGYDMSKLQCGAFGTLSVLTEVTLRTVPQPETGCTLALAGLGDAEAIPLLAQALNTPYEVSAAAHLPARIVARSGVLPALGWDKAATLLRLEGHGPSVSDRAQRLIAVLNRPVTRIEPTRSSSLWREIGQVSPLLPPTGRVIWRLCSTPSAAPGLAGRIGADFPGTEIFYDWGGGLLWLSLDTTAAGPDGGAETIRAAIRTAGGHATLIVAPAAMRETVPVFEPEPAPLAALSRRVKDSFDPHHLLNPGRLLEGL